MNEVIGTTAKLAQQPIVLDKISGIQSQQNNFQGLLKDLHSISDRIKSIGLKINSTEHPTNNVIDSIGGENKAESIPEQTLDGILLELRKVYNTNEDFLKEFNIRIYPNISEFLLYIEQHI